jgi:hypothetical protein
MSTQATRRADAERKANSVTVQDNGATDTITRLAAGRCVSKGVLRFDQEANVYRINDPFTWSDVDFFS